LEGHSKPGCRTWGAVNLAPWVVLLTLNILGHAFLNFKYAQLIYVGDNWDCQSFNHPSIHPSIHHHPSIFHSRSCACLTGITREGKWQPIEIRVSYIWKICADHWWTEKNPSAKPCALTCDTNTLEAVFLKKLWLWRNDIIRFYFMAKNIFILNRMTDRSAYTSEQVLKTQKEK
jgi:hypothetical protein